MELCQMSLKVASLWLRQQQQKKRRIFTTLRPTIALQRDVGKFYMGVDECQAATFAGVLMVSGFIEARHESFAKAKCPPPLS